MWISEINLMPVCLRKMKHKWSGLNVGCVWFKKVTNVFHCFVKTQALLCCPPCVPCLLFSLCVRSVTDQICSSFLWPKVCAGVGACSCLCKSENMHVWIHALTVCMHLYLITCMSVCVVCSLAWFKVRLCYWSAQFSLFFSVYRACFCFVLFIWSLSKLISCSTCHMSI